jgi:hypothetical protein
MGWPMKEGGLPLSLTLRLTAGSRTPSSSSSLTRCWPHRRSLDRAELVDGELPGGAAGSAALPSSSRICCCSLPQLQRSEKNMTMWPVARLSSATSPRSLANSWVARKPPAHSFLPRKHVSRVNCMCVAYLCPTRDHGSSARRHTPARRHSSR